MTTYETDKTEKFLIMNDIEKRAKELTAELAPKYTFCASHVGYKMAKSAWKDAKDAGFKKEADGRWIGFTKSYNGEGGAAEVAYAQALAEKKAEIAATGATSSFLDNVSVYEYLV